MASLIGLGNHHTTCTSRTTFLEVNWISYWFIVTSLLSNVNHVSLKEFPPLFISFKKYSISLPPSSYVLEKVCFSILFLPFPSQCGGGITSNWCLLPLITPIQHKKQFPLYKGALRASTWTYEQGFWTAKEVCVPFVHFNVAQICPSGIYLMLY